MRVLNRVASVLEGADSFDSVKQRIINNYKGNFRADEWNLTD
jgi:hypothetical protein